MQRSVFDFTFYTLTREHGRHLGRTFFFCISSPDVIMRRERRIMGNVFRVDVTLKRSARDSLFGFIGLSWSGTSRRTRKHKDRRIRVLRKNHKPPVILYTGRALLITFITMYLYMLVFIITLKFYSRRTRKWSELSDFYSCLSFQNITAGFNPVFEGV